LTAVFKVPVPPLALEKNSLVEVELTESVTPPEPAVAGLLKLSRSWKPSLMLVVVEAAVEVGVGVITAWVGAPAVLVAEKVGGLATPEVLVVTLYVPEVLLAVKAEAVACPLALVVATH
jgi:hypothetical protein